MLKNDKTPTITQWFKNGDHPDDNCKDGEEIVNEGKVVRYYRSPKLS